jgi:beta-galactosidase
MMNNSIFFILLMLAFGACTGKANKPNGLNEGEISIYQLQSRNGDDPFLIHRYLELNDSPMQQKLRNLKPFPVGVVYYQQREDNLESITEQFQIIRSLGFTALKQVVLGAPSNGAGFEEKVFHAALNQGIYPWYYGQGGWITISQSLVDSLGIALEVNQSNLADIQTHPRMIHYQITQMHKRVDRMKNKPVKPKGMGEPGRNSPFLTARLITEFSKWLQKEYTSIERLKDAWNFGFVETPEIRTFEDAAKLLVATYSDEYNNRWGKLSWDMRRMRDAMRFQADLIIDHYNQTMKVFNAWDPEEPERTGGHQLFENQAINSWDLEAQAKTAALGGSFYSSIHLAHHFFLVDGETGHPVYMQSRIVADMFKGGWAATWESTGGPTQWSGHHNLNVSENSIRQLFLSYIAAGLKGIGIWTWNSRGEGWEAGEYALTDIQGDPTARAREAGRLSGILQQQRFELWDAFDEPVVGVLYSWENESILGRLSMGSYQLSTPVYQSNRDRAMRQYHSEAKIGISRALMNHNVPFEYVTERDIKAGLAARYPVIYLPYILALDHNTLKGLKEYVAEGGRLVADFPLLMLDDYGRLNKQLPGSDFNELFGFSTADYYHSSDGMKTYRQENLNSQFGELKLSGAQVTDRWDDGTPAILTHNYGKGSVLVFNFEASRAAFKPGNATMEQLLVSGTLGKIRSPFYVENNSNTMVFRRAAPHADHYFIINNSNEESIWIGSKDITYAKAYDVLEGADLNMLNNKVQLKVPAHSGAWIRMEKVN